MERSNFLRSSFFVCLKGTVFFIFTVRTIFTYTKSRVKILRAFCRDYHPFKDDGSNLRCPDTTYT